MGQVEWSAARAAHQFRRQLDLDPSQRVDLEAICSALGIELRIARLYPERGGVEAMLIPRPHGGFRIVVDPTPKAGWGGVPARLRAVVARHRARFRIAHELAHTLFYAGVGGVSQPRRWAPVGSELEEQFADCFAAAFLVAAPEPAANATELVDLQRHFDVSLEVAVRAYADKHAKTELTLWHWGSADARPLVQWSNVENATVRQAPGSLAELRSMTARDEGRSLAVLPVRRQALALRS